MLLKSIFIALALIIGLAVAAVAAGIIKLEFKWPGGGYVSGQNVVVTLNYQNDSGQSGSATLSELRQKTQILVSTINGAEELQPAHIHVGDCTSVSAVKYPLNSLNRGVSATLIDVPLVQLMSELPLAIVAHKSDQEPAVYTACGDIKP